MKVALVFFVAAFIFSSSSSAEPNSTVIVAGKFPAIQAYSAGDYTKIHYEESDSANALRARLADELASLPAEPGTVWHGGCVSDAELTKYRVDSEKIFRFLSTTKVASIAFNYGNVRFSQSGHTCRPILLKLSQFSGRDIKSFSAFPEEQEVLLGPQDKFKIVAHPDLKALPADVYAYLKQFNRLGVFNYFEFDQVNPALQ